MTSGTVITSKGCMIHAPRCLDYTRVSVLDQLLEHLLMGPWRARQLVHHPMHCCATGGLARVPSLMRYLIGVLMHTTHRGRC